MKHSSRYRLTIAVLILSVFLAGCGLRSGVSWPDVDVTTGFNDETQLVVAYSDYIERVDLNGNQVVLRFEDGTPRTEGNDQRRWEINGEATDSNFYVTPIELDENTLLVPDYNDQLLIYDVSLEFVRLREGANSRIQLPGHVLASPTLYEPEGADRLVLVPISEQNVIAYNVDDNFSEAWVFETERGVWASPLIIDSTAYIPGTDHFLYVVNVETGEELYRVDLGGAIGATPYYDGEGALYVGSFDRHFWRIDITGEYDDPQERVTAQYNTEGWVWAAPTVFDGKFYITDMNGFVYALSINEDGTEFIEEVKRQASSAGLRSKPIVTETYIVVASRNGNVYWLDRQNAEELIKDNIDSEILADLVYIEEDEAVSRPALVIVSTSDNDKVLIPYTIDGDEYTWIYDR